MIPGLKKRAPNRIPIYGCDGSFINITIPDVYYSMEEADSVCRDLCQKGFYCGIIYRYVNRINGKGYIGQTIHPVNRHKSHLGNAKSETPNGIFGKALKRYGIRCFDYYILDIKSDKDEEVLHQLLDESEKYYIKWYHTSVKEWGYNIAPGGWGLPSQSQIEKAVDMFDLSGQYLKTFPSLSKASAQLGFSGPTIRQVCNHIHYTAGGYLWAWSGEKPILPPDNRVFAYNENGEYVTEYENEFIASKCLGGKNGGIYLALKDKYRMAYGFYWRRYKEISIPLSDFPKAVYAYDTNGYFVKGFINLSKAKEFIKDVATSSISHAIIRKTAHKGYLWRTEYSERIDPTDGRFINKMPVTAIFPNGTLKKYGMIKDAAIDIGVSTGSIQRSIKNSSPSYLGIRFIRSND